MGSFLKNSPLLIIGRLRENWRQQNTLKGLVKNRPLLRLFTNKPLKSICLSKALCLALNFSCPQFSRKQKETEMEKTAKVIRHPAAKGSIAWKLKDIWEEVERLTAEINATCDRILKSDDTK